MERLSGLRPGSLRSAFEQQLNMSPTAQLQDSLVESVEGDVFLKQYLYVLDTAFVQAFVDSRDSIAAFSVTIRADDAIGELQAGMWTFNIGSTRIIDVPFTSRSMVAQACGAHIGSYFEVSSPPNAERNQQVAVGYTSTGGRVGGDPLGCPGPDFTVYAGLPKALYPGDDEYRVVDMYAPHYSFFELHEESRQILINAYAVADSLYGISPEMVALHPDTVAQFVDSD